MSAPNIFLSGPRPDTMGYGPMGDLMGSYNDLAIFRRFRNVSALDLLYRQQEIQGNLYRWADLAQADRTSGDGNRSEFHVDFERLLRSAYAEGDTSLQRRQWNELSALLQVYYDRLLKFQKICELPSVDETHLRQLREHLINVEKGNGFMRGPVQEDIYAELNEADLTSITAPPDPDLFLRFSRGQIVDWFHKLFYAKSEKITNLPKIGQQASYSFWFKAYSPENAALLSRVLVSILTAAFITIAILSLNIVQKANFRIVLIFIHSLFFSVAMGVIARARAAELFAFSAAYAAVLVVYASGSSGLLGRSDS